MQGPILGVDVDGGPVVFFDKRRNQVGWNEFGWDDMYPEEQQAVVQFWESLTADQQA